MFMYLTMSKLKQVLRSRKGLGKVSTTTLVINYRFTLNIVTIEADSTRHEINVLV